MLPFLFLKANILMPLNFKNKMYLGFSAATGEIYDNHDLVSVMSRHSKIGYKPNMSNINTKKVAQSGYGWTFLKIISFGVIVGAVYFVYTTKSKPSNKRF